MHRLVINHRAAPVALPLDKVESRRVLYCVHVALGSRPTCVQL